MVSGDRVVVRPPTMQDVAKRAGSSKTTVSNMLSGRRSVSAETQQRIQAAIDELGFRLNETARALRTQRTDVVAMILGNIAHEANPQIARGAGEVLRAADRTLAIYETNSDDHSLSDCPTDVDCRSYRSAAAGRIVSCISVDADARYAEPTGLATRLLVRAVSTRPV